MPLEVSGDVNIELLVTDAGDKRWRNKLGVALLCSAVLHGLVLLPFFLMHRGAVEPHDIFQIVPVDVVELAEETAGPPQPRKAPVPEQKAGRASSPVSRPAGVSPSGKRPPPDELEIKLRALAKLRQPGIDTPTPESDMGLSKMSAMSDGAVRGPAATYSVKDFIRAQVERRWSLDLAILGTRNFSVLIRVEMTSGGVVTEAEIVDTARFAADKAYREIALSARNAVLLASPFALPPGHYKKTMAMTLSLNPRDTLR